MTPAPVTAYVMAAMMEAGEEINSTLVTRAAKCLASDTSVHPYTLALKAYAMARAGLPETGIAVKNLMNMATVTRHETHWKMLQGHAGNYPQ